jgi:outer membrane biosynthesis protein TonB
MIKWWVSLVIACGLTMSSAMADPKPSDAQTGAGSFDATRKEALRYCSTAPSATMQELRDFYAKNAADYAQYGDEAAPADAKRVETAILKRPAARYPRSLKGTGAAGKVMLMIAISAEGTAADSIVVCSDHPDFTAAARNGLDLARFSPQKNDGLAVGSVAFLPFTFIER